MINIRLVFKIKQGFKLELKNLATIKLFSSTNKLLDKTKTGENAPILKLVEVVLVQCNFVDNQYQRKSKALYTFVHNKSYVHLLNVELSNLVLLKTYTEFDKIIITFMYQNGRPLEIEDKVNLTMLINKKK